jgi:hypothetical protein
MATIYSELFLEQGATFNTSVTIDDTGGANFDLTGYTGSSQIRKSYYSNSVAGEFVVTTGDDPTQGIIFLDMAANTTANIASGRYVYDVYVDNNVVRLRVAEGIINVTPQVTKKPGML